MADRCPACGKGRPSVHFLDSHAATELPCTCARPAAAMQFRPISARLGLAMREGAGIDAQNVVGCSLEVAGPGEVYLNLRLFLDGEAAAKVLKAIAAVDLNSEEWG